MLARQLGLPKIAFLSHKIHGHLVADEHRMMNIKSCMSYNESVVNIICLILTVLFGYPRGPTEICRAAEVSPGTLQLTRCGSCRFNDGQGVYSRGQ